jgi:outer membrane protein assembly factor BamB
MKKIIIIASSLVFGIYGFALAQFQPETLWTHSPIPTSSGHITTVSTPSIDLQSGTIYFAECFNRRIYSINLETGERNWVAKCWGLITSSSAVGENGTVYVGISESGGNPDRFLALNPDGTEKWDWRGVPFCASPAIGEDGTVYIASTGSVPMAYYLRAFSPNGDIKWEFPVGNNSLSAPAIAEDGTIYCASMSPQLYSISPDGTERWRFEMDSGLYKDSPAIGGEGTIYCCTSSNTLYAINPDGTEKWRMGYGGDYSYDLDCGGDVVVDRYETVYCQGKIWEPGTSTSYLMAVNGHDGTEKWRSYGYAQAFLVGTDDIIYVARDEYIVALDVNNGSEVWRYHIGNELRVWTRLNMGNNGVLYFCAGQEYSEGKLYALQTESQGVDPEAPWPQFRHDMRQTSCQGSSHTGIDNKVKAVPQEFELHQNYPNPFNPTTTIGYNLPTDEHIELVVYDINGKEIAQLISAQQSAGNHKVNWDASGLSSGIYFYRIQTGEFVETRRTILLK